jgi:asparagine synthase (glutamine-hydrolysing)
MCGITGFLDTSRRRDDDALTATVGRMRDSLRHRGPDDAGQWSDPEVGIALGFRRLAILDLTERGHQPMCSPDGRYYLVFNGEIYNHHGLRDELERLGLVFRGSSDTEVMLAAFSRWGIEKTLPKLNGMFATAVWDRQERTLSLARDRMGEKPLYYGWVGRSFVFGSELKALRSHPDFHPEVDREALTLFFRHKYVPAPWSIYRGISKLLPGTSLTLKEATPGVTPEPRAYWTVASAVERGRREPFEAGDDEALEELDTLLRDAVGMRMEADVPLGAFLSGGVDSSAVVALMQAQSSARVKTFTIGLREPGYDESAFARTVAGHLGTEHKDITVTPEEARAVIPLLPRLYDEPFADSSQVPTYLVSQLAVDHVTVALSGDGGDEVFGGYNRYQRISSVWSRVGWLPAPARSAAARALSFVPARIVDRAFERFPRFARGEAGQRPGDKLQKFARALAASDPDDMYSRLVSHWDPPAPLVVGGSEPRSRLADADGPEGLTAAERAMYLDSMTYLPDDILAKVDRASMGVSLEARAPFLDHRVVEFAWRLPLRMKVRDGEGKWLLRRVLDRYVPRGLVDRPKAGFGVPIGDWLRGPLRPWAEELFDESRLRGEGFVNPELVRRRWAEHVSGRHNWQYPLWDVLMFQSWLEAERSARNEMSPRSIGAS